MATTHRRRWRAGTLMLLSVALCSMAAAYHYATGLELGGGVFEQIGFGRIHVRPAPVVEVRGETCTATDCRQPPADSQAR